MESEPLDSRVWEAMLEAGGILVTTHVRADGDALGSMLALHFALLEAGKNATPVLDSEIPRIYGFLPGADRIVRPTGKRLPSVDLAVVLDTATWDRIGSVGPMVEGLKIVNIDHHESNARYGHVNVVEPRLSSTGEMVWRLLKNAGRPITPDMATLLYVAILTDTGRFMHYNTSADCLRVAAELVEAGARPDRIGRRIYKSYTLEQLRLRSMSLATLRVVEGGLVAVMELSEEMFKATGVRPVDTQIFVDMPASIDGVEVAFLLRDVIGTGSVKVSFRSHGRVNVNKVAAEFGGGGHPEAAGCEIRAGRAEAAEMVLNVIRRYLRDAGLLDAPGREGGTEQEDVCESTP